jgi:hypothetical protein
MVEAQVQTRQVVEAEVLQVLEAAATSMEFKLVVVVDQQQH